MKFSSYINLLKKELILLIPNKWDYPATIILFFIFLFILIGLNNILYPMSHINDNITGYFNLQNLVKYSICTMFRMLLAIFISIIFTFIFGTLAAKSKCIAIVLVPILDVLQSVPILGYISFTVTFFLSLFSSKTLGLELAAIFAIFTSQAWNMTFSFYHSLCSIPNDLKEISRCFHLSSWQNFWKLDVPYAMPNLIWNMMISMSGGWTFIVASEVITVKNNSVALIGIGSYLSQAILQKNIAAIIQVILAMIFIILIYDQLLFRPLLSWADKFRIENITKNNTTTESWVLNLFRNTQLIKRILFIISYFLLKKININLVLIFLKKKRFFLCKKKVFLYTINLIFTSFFLIFLIYIFNFILKDILYNIHLNELYEAFTSALVTLIRVIILIIISSMLWVPLGVIIGLRTKLTSKIQPLIQFFAAFPVNILFPIFALVIVRFNLNPNIWLSPLMLLGAQWYILFNILAGISSLPSDYHEVVKNFHISGFQWWKKIIIPFIFPNYITGVISATGGAWNMSIISEFIQWGNIQITAYGIGSYITKNTMLGNFQKIALGIIVMSLFIIIINYIIWRPLYKYFSLKIKLN